MIEDTPSFLRRESVDPSALGNAANHCGILLLDVDGNVTAASALIERITGWSPNSIVGQSASVLYVPDAPTESQLESHLAAAVEHGQCEDRGERVTHDGRRFLVTVVTLALRGEKSELTGFAKLICDRAAIDSAVAELRVREAHLRAIIDAVPAAVVTIDETGTILAISGSAERQFGYDESELVGCNVSVLMPQPYQDQHDSYIARYLATGEKRVIDSSRIVTGIRKDGSTFPLEISIGETKLDGRRFFTGFMRDMTERQLAEARLQELQAELIHVSRLSALGEMASSLAHELNQPMGAIANYVKGCRRLIERDGEVDKAVLIETLDLAANEALRSGQIINRLREFVANGESERRIEFVNRLVEDAGTIALIGARDMRIQVRYELDPKANYVLADRILIQQVLLNLIRNAVEAMDGCARRELTISTRARLDDFVEFRVSDTGIGLSEEVADKLFQPFVTSKRRGMGVGLSICRTIVEAHGGDIWVEPNPGGGTIFAFTLGIVEAEDRDD